MISGSMTHEEIIEKLKLKKKEQNEIDFKEEGNKDKKVNKEEVNQNEIKKERNKDKKVNNEQIMTEMCYNGEFRREGRKSRKYYLNAFKLFSSIIMLAYNLISLMFFYFEEIWYYVSKDELIDLFFSY